MEFTVLSWAGCPEGEAQQVQWVPVGAGSQRQARQDELGNQSSWGLSLGTRAWENAPQGESLRVSCMAPKRHTPCGYRAGKAGEQPRAKLGRSRATERQSFCQPGCFAKSDLLEVGPVSRAGDTQAGSFRHLEDQGPMDPGGCRQGHSCPLPGDMRRPLSKETSSGSPTPPPTPSLASADSWSQSDKGCAEVQQALCSGRVSHLV